MSASPSQNKRQRKEKIMIYRFRLSLFMLAGLLATTPAFAQELSGTLKKVKESGTIVMGIRESSYPLSYLDAKQQPIGYHIEICNKIVDAVKRELQVNLKVQHQPVTSQHRIPLVTNGTVDIECGSTTNNEARQKQRASAGHTFGQNGRVAVKETSGGTGA